MRHPRLLTVALLLARWPGIDHDDDDEDDNDDDDDDDDDDVE